MGTAFNSEIPPRTSASSAVEQNFLPRRSRRFAEAGFASISPVGNFRLLASVVLMALLCVAAGPRPLLKGDPWLGDWKVKLTPSGDDANKPGVKEIDEELTFTQDEMSAKTLAAKGFKPAKFDEDTTVMGPATMKCTQTSDTDGKLEWMGMATGQDMTGNLVWTRKDETQIHYDIQGAKKP